MNFRVYVPFGGDIELLKKCVASIVERVGTFSSEPRTVVLINNTLEPLPQDFPNRERLEELIPPVELVHAQEINWVIKESRARGEDFALLLHTDAQLKDGALEDMFGTLEEVKDTRWAQVLGYGSGVFCALNWRFFDQERVDFDPFLFPFYYMDNHMYRIIEARGWRIHITRRAHENLVEHVSSHILKNDPVFRRKNDLAFPLHGVLYEKIWGGLPGKEKHHDRTAGGTLRS